MCCETSKKEAHQPIHFQLTQKISQDAKIRVDKEQTEVDVKLQLRVGDVEFWKGELDNKLAQIKEEIEEAVSGK